MELLILLAILLYSIIMACIIIPIVHLNKKMKLRAQSEAKWAEIRKKQSQSAAQRNEILQRRPVERRVAVPYGKDFRENLPSRSKKESNDGHERHNNNEDFDEEDIEERLDILDEEDYEEYMEEQGCEDHDDICSCQDPYDEENFYDNYDDPYNTPYDQGGFVDPNGCYDPFDDDE